MKHLGTKTIETRRLVLRRFTLSDAEPMYRNWASDPEVTRYLLWPAHESEEETKGILKGWIAAYDKPEKYEWCIELKEIGEAIGSIGVVQGMAHGAASFLIWIFTESQKRNSME